ncbi:MAG: hypothetical protein RRA15_05645 [bacterium]|nr:hypothetical protein [bacterium]MDT8365960.1 hypothetical protein [bacterium]
MGKVRVYLCISVMAAVLAVGAGSAMAAPLKTNLYGLDGLFMATGGTVIPAGALAVGGSALILSDDNRDITSVPVTVTFGASSKVEIAAAFEVYKSVDYGGGVDDTGTGDLYLAAKYALLEEDADYPGTAVGLRIKLPMADYPLSSEESDVAIFGAAELDMKGVRGILNVEYLMPGGDADNQMIYVVGVGIPYSDTTEFTLEIMDQSLVNDIFAAGATFDLGSSLNFGVAVGFGLNDFSADSAVMGKLNFIF